MTEKLTPYMHGTYSTVTPFSTLQPLLLEAFKIHERKDGPLNLSTPLSLKIVNMFHMIFADVIKVVYNKREYPLSIWD